MINERPGSQAMQTFGRRRRRRRQGRPRVEPSRKADRLAVAAMPQPRLRDPPTRRLHKHKHEHDDGEDDDDDDALLASGWQQSREENPLSARPPRHQVRHNVNTMDRTERRPVKVDDCSTFRLV